MGQRTRRVMSQAETVAMHALMNQHIEWDFTIPIEERRVSYRGDWDDEKIAKAVAPDLNANHARTLRQNLFGQLKDAKAADAEERVKALESLVEAQRVRLVELMDQHNRLVSTLSLNKIVDVRHLAVKEDSMEERP